MPIAAQKIMPCLWFDDQAEDAAKFYCSIFKNSRIETISRYGKDGQEIHGREGGLGHGRGVRARRAEIRRPERWSPIQVHRGDLVSESTARTSRRSIITGASSPPKAVRKVHAAG